MSGGPRLPAWWCGGLAALLLATGFVLAPLHPRLIGMGGDDAYFATYARALAEHHAYVDPLGPEDRPAVRYPPLYPATLAALMLGGRWAGGGPPGEGGPRAGEGPGGWRPERAFPALSLASHLAAVGIAAWLGVAALGLSPALALAGAAIAALNPTAALHAGLAMSDLPAALVTALALLVFHRLGRSPGSFGLRALAALAAAACAAIRPAAAVVPLAAALGLAWPRGHGGARPEAEPPAAAPPGPPASQRLGDAAAPLAGLLAFLLPWYAWVASHRGEEQIAYFRGFARGVELPSALAASFGEMAFATLPSLLLPIYPFPGLAEAPLARGLLALVGLGVLAAIGTGFRRWPTGVAFVAASATLSAAYAAVFLEWRGPLQLRYMLAAAPYAVMLVLAALAPRPTAAVAFASEAASPIPTRKTGALSRLLLPLLLAGSLSLELAGLASLRARAMGLQRARDDQLDQVCAYLRDRTPADAVVAAYRPGYPWMYAGRRPLDLTLLDEPEGLAAALAALRKQRPVYLLDYSVNAARIRLLARVEAAHPGFFVPRAAVPSRWPGESTITVWEVAP